MPFHEEFLDEGNILSSWSSQAGFRTRRNLFRVDNLTFTFRHSVHIFESCVLLQVFQLTALFVIHPIERVAINRESVERVISAYKTLCGILHSRRELLLIHWRGYAEQRCGCCWQCDGEQRARSMVCVWGLMQSAVISPLQSCREKGVVQHKVSSHTSERWLGPRGLALHQRVHLLHVLESESLTLQKRYKLSTLPFGT